MSLLVIDCDDFKEINDRAGHEFGDALLHQVARIPFDGATPSALFLAADHALYAAKSAGKDQIASFRDVVRVDPTVVDGSRPESASVGAGAETVPPWPTS